MDVVASWWKAELGSFGIPNMSFLTLGAGAYRCKLGNCRPSCDRLAKGVPYTYVMNQPLLSVQSHFFTANRSGEASPRNIIKSSLALKSTKVAAATYLMSAISALFIHIITVYTSEVYHRGDPKLTIFVRSKLAFFSPLFFLALKSCFRKHPHYLNGRLLFLIISQISTAFAFTLRGAMADRFAYRWAFAVSSSFPLEIPPLLPDILSSSKQRMLSYHSLSQFPMWCRSSSLVWPYLPLLQSSFWHASPFPSYTRFPSFPSFYGHLQLTSLKDLGLSRCR